VADERTSELPWRSTAPLDANDPPRFGESREGVVDLLASWLKAYFDRTNAPAGHLAEVPGLRKWMTYAQTNGLGGPVPPAAPGAPQPRNTGGGGGGAVPTAGGAQLPSRAVTVAAWGETCEDMPRVVVGVPRLTDVPQFNRHRVGSGGAPPQIDSATAGPFVVVVGDTLTLLVYRNIERRAGEEAAEVEITIETEDAIDYDAMTAAELAAVINRQGAPYVGARAMADGTLRVFAENGQMSRGGVGPAWLEVSGGTLATTLGWGRGGALTSLAASGSDWLATLAGAPAVTADDVGRYLTLAGTTRPSRNDGRFLIATAPSATTVTADIPYGVADAAPTDATWWIGEYASTVDTQKSVRRLKISRADVELRVLAEDFNAMQALADAVQTLVSFFADRDSGSIIGRGLLQQSGLNAVGITQPAAPTQAMGLHIIPPVAVSGDMKTPRPGDAESGIYECFITFQVYVQEVLDRTLPTSPTDLLVTVRPQSDA